MALRRATVPADEVPEHSHETAHLILAVDEGYRSDAAGADAWRGPAMLVYNPPGTVHRDRFEQTGGRFLSIDVPDGMEPAGIIDAIALTSGPARMAANRVIASMLTGGAPLQLEDGLVALSAALLPRENASPEPPSWLRIAVEAARDLADDPALRVHDLAACAGVHPSHLARAFARHIGCSPGAAIRRVRIDRVAAALRTRQSITTVAAAHGFSDHAHLTRCFRSAFGVTPSAFRTAFD
ncbi:AraC family transcriptional regulator [Sphingomonas jejuensis]|uniref:AraC family transcriptional regulator n=1 Tax=Sphingomonas jejuensis TaxID=904715 RepID=A0ABX0XLG9_9SPHN|nr:AraC family transcriptional regulator [Sphingomonas jejuensis]